jgi:hypothetical protein
MAGIGFALIITLVLLGRSSGPRDVSGTPRGSLDDAEIDPGDASGPRNAQESTA